MCELADIISEIPDTTICLSQQDNEMVICIPKRGMSMKLSCAVSKHLFLDYSKALVTQICRSDLDFFIIVFLPL